jgi:glycosyltransferase involved in cell wall biosynthesis
VNGIRVEIVDPSAFTPPYDHALAAALARAGADVTLVTSEFAYGSTPPPDGYDVRLGFYRHARGTAGSRLRRATKLTQHVPDMLSYRRRATHVDVAHFQWLDVQWLDGWLLPRRPTVLTAHDLLPREPRPGQTRAQRRLYDAVDAVVVHSEYGRRQLVDGLALDAAKVHVIHHGAFDHLVRPRDEQPLPDDLARVEQPVVLFFGLLRPYKGIDSLLTAWRDVRDAELWIVGQPRIALEPLRSLAGPGVRFMPRFVADAELGAYFRRADVVVLPYTRTERFDFSGVLATALAFGKPTVLSDVGGFGEVAATGAARLVPPDDAPALAAAINDLVQDESARAKLAAAAARAAAGSYSWDVAAARTVALYGSLVGHNPPP